MPIDALLRSDKAKSTLNGFLGGAAGGALVSALTNNKSAKKLLKTGGLVALGGVAWSAYQKYRSSGEVTEDAVVLDPEDYQRTEKPSVSCLSETVLFRAMAAAAYADGHLDAEEQNKIWQCAIDNGIEGEALDNLERLLRHPPRIDQVVADASDMQSKLEIYTASKLVIDDQCIEAREYLSDLKQRLNLPAALIEAVDARTANE